MFSSPIRACLWTYLLLAAVWVSAESPPFKKSPLSPYPLEKKIHDLIGKGIAVKNWMPSGVDERLYVELSEPIVRQAVAWQDETGRIIDPFMHVETPTATPRFVGALAGLILRGRCLDLMDNCRGALTAAAEDLASADRKTVQGAEFYTKELMLGFLALRDNTDARGESGTSGCVQTRSPALCPLGPALARPPAGPVYQE